MLLKRSAVRSPILAMAFFLIWGRASEAAPNPEPGLPGKERAAVRSGLTTDEKLQALEEELERLKVQKATKTYESRHGMGPAASAVYRPDEGLSLGGYAEVNGDTYKSRYRKGTGELERFVLYAGFRFNDWILFNSEIEFEHAGFERVEVVTDNDFGARTSKKETIEKSEAGVEFAYLDFAIRDYFQVRTGLTLVPIGITNYQHEPTTFHSVHRPLTETTLIPSTWRELGVLIHGEIAGGRLLYRVGLLSGLDATRFSGSDWIGEDGSFRGSQATLRDGAFIGNVDGRLTDSLTLGGSYYAGRAGQGNVPTISTRERLVPAPADIFRDEQAALDAQAYLSATREQARVLVHIAEGHFLFKKGPWDARGLLVRGWMSTDDTKAVNRQTGENVGKTAEGGYLELAFNALSLVKTDQRLMIFVRKERVNTQRSTVQRYAGDHNDLVDAWCTAAANCRTTDTLADGNRTLGFVAAEDSRRELYGVKGVSDRVNDRTIWTLGVAYFPHPNVALKLEYARHDSRTTYYRDQEYLNPGNNKIDQINFGMALIL